MKTVRRSFTATVVPLIALAAVLFAASSTAIAQSEESGSARGLEVTWGDGLEGTWNAQLTVTDCNNPNTVIRSFPAKFSYAKGGTLAVTTAGQLPSLSTAGLGVWNHMYGRTYSAVSEAFIFSSAGAWTSTQRLTRVIVVSRDAKAYTDTVALEILDTSGKVIITGCATSVASRLE
ncbi:MAG TPA: hypothetical protein VKH40_14425 [Alloacidobacterium sp.]|nr:hypothetical protein [Alloacidobacterium sp.]